MIGFDQHTSRLPWNLPQPTDDATGVVGLVSRVISVMDFHGNTWSGIVSTVATVFVGPLIPELHTTEGFFHK
jgi:hypothetical protein